MIALPWVRHRQEVQAARERAAAAERAAIDSQRRRAAAMELASESRASSNFLKRQIQRNGWTDMLQDAWGSRA